MEEETNTGAGGTGITPAVNNNTPAINNNTPVVNNNIDFSEVNKYLQDITDALTTSISEVNKYLQDITNALTTPKQTIIRNCAMTLYANTNFESSNKSPIIIAKECVDRALIIAKELQNRNLL